MVFRIPRTAADDAAGPVLNVRAAIDEFYQDFPQHRHDVFILNHQEFKDCLQAVASIRPEMARLKEQYRDLSYVGAMESIVSGAFEAKLPCSVNIGQKLFNNQDEQKIYARVVIPAGDDFHARALKSFLSSSAFDDVSAFPVMPMSLHNTEMWQRYVLEHELGHAVTVTSVNRQEGKTQDLSHRQECEADAYAMIRHFQRYGRDSLFPAFIRDLRNMNALHSGEVTHWTSRAIDRVIEMNEFNQVAHLTPAEARDTAIRIAKEVAISTAAAHNLGRAADQIKSVMRKKNISSGNRVVLTLAAVAGQGAQTRSPIVLEACRRYINHIRNYVPKDMAQTVDRSILEKAAEDVRAMQGRVIDAEPPVPAIKKAIQGAFIDAMSGKRPDVPTRREIKPPQPYSG